jgi:site-specific DNA-methyltransferase (adenine-specific)
MGTILHGDCLELMKDIPDKSIDMILCDLPYGTTACKWDTIIPFEPLWEQYKRIIKDNGAIVLTASQPFTSALVMSNPKMFKYEWIWDKKLSSGALNANHRPMKRHENVCVFSKGKCAYMPEMRTGKLRTRGGGKASQCYGKVVPTKSISDQYYPTTILDFSNANQRGKVHPTQKPVALFEYLIKTYTNEGDLVLDNCAGSGTTGVACKNTGRNFILIEKEQEYVDIIHKRLAECKV